MYKGREMKNRVRFGAGLVLAALALFVLGTAALAAPGGRGVDAEIDSVL